MPLWIASSWGVETWVFPATLFLASGSSTASSLLSRERSAWRNGQGVQTERTTTLVERQFSLRDAIQTRFKAIEEWQANARPSVGELAPTASPPERLMRNSAGRYFSGTPVMPDAAFVPALAKIFPRRRNRPCRPQNLQARFAPLLALPSSPCVA
jgi:hypothetical protein